MERSGARHHEMELSAALLLRPPAPSSPRVVSNSRSPTSRLVMRAANNLPLCLVANVIGAGQDDRVGIEHAVTMPRVVRSSIYVVRASISRKPTTISVSLSRRPTRMLNKVFTWRILKRRGLKGVSSARSELERGGGPRPWHASRRSAQCLVHADPMLFPSTASRTPRRE
ncbi:hypothetical protein ANO11243_041820 [Dothideomycetidae sp. 11243]|nr:hypothetical protein ANO11243_041820 [fungal sp. No.11243]